MSPRLSAALVLALGLPGLATAEGARLVVTCTGTGGATTVFTIAPTHTDDTGKGQIEVTWEGESYDGVTSSDRGPFQFGTDTDHYALLINGDTDDGRLDVTLHHAGPSGSTLTPYTCETSL